MPYIVISIKKCKLLSMEDWDEGEICFVYWVCILHNGVYALTQTSYFIFLSTFVRIKMGFKLFNYFNYFRVQSANHYTMETF